MIEMTHYETENIYTVVYNGPVTLEDYENLVKKAEKLLSALADGKKMTNITNLSNGKVVNKDVVKAMADFTKRNTPYFNKIHIVGMSAFMKILYRTFLVLLGKNNVTIVEERTFEDVCTEYKIHDIKKAAI